MYIYTNKVKEGVIYYTILHHVRALNSSKIYIIVPTSLENEYNLYLLKISFLGYSNILLNISSNVLINVLSYDFKSRNNTTNNIINRVFILKGL